MSPLSEGYMTMWVRERKYTPHQIDNKVRSNPERVRGKYNFKIMTFVVPIRPTDDMIAYHFIII